MTDPYILQAREMLADEIEKWDCPDTAANYRNGYCDGYTAVIVLARVLREHAEKQPTFEQRVEAIRAATGRPDAAAITWLYAYDRHLAEIMAPKVDPLVEVLADLGWSEPTFEQKQADDLRKALADRGLKIVPEEAA